jgi:hypothetical protein
MAAPSPCASPAIRALATSFPAALQAHRHSQPPPPPPPPQAMPTIPEEAAPAARMTVDTRLAADAAVMESPVLTGRRSPPPVSSPSVTKLPGLELAMRSSTKRELLLPALSAARAAGASASPSAIFSSLTPPPPSRTPSPPPPKREGESAAAAAARRKKGTRRGTLHPEAKNVLKAWMFSPEHFAHPYPSEEEKEELASEAGIEVKQLSNWFTNARKRLWQPVLRQSGVEVKNFLSTGRGGPRGNKLEVPANLQQLVASSLAAATADDSPPSSPGREDGEDSDASMRSPLKRSWSDVQASLLASPAAAAAAGEAPAKRKKAPAAGKKRRAQELRLVLADKAAARAFPFPAGDASPASVARFRDVELLAASSLLGLHQQPYQPVH